MLVLVCRSASASPTSPQSAGSTFECFRQEGSSPPLYATSNMGPHPGDDFGPDSGEGLPADEYAEMLQDNTSLAGTLD